MVYGLTLENECAIVSRAATKENGVYKFRGVGYSVMNGKVTHYSCNGQVLERCFGFNCVIGNYSGESSHGIKLLRGIK